MTTHVLEETAMTLCHTDDESDPTTSKMRRQQSQKLGTSFFETRAVQGLREDKNSEEITCWREGQRKKDPLCRDPEVGVSFMT